MKVKLKFQTIYITIIILIFISCKKKYIEEKEVHYIIDKWHAAAAQADYGTYFELMNENAIYIGTDATERWNKRAFQAYAKPHFDRGKAWTFRTLRRTIKFDNTGNTAWFDELLDTSFKICRGSGVMVKTDSGWKVAHYVLSMTIPNESTKTVVEQKDSIESILIKELDLGKNQK